MLEKCFKNALRPEWPEESTLRLLWRMYQEGVTYGELVEHCLWDPERASRFLDQLSNWIFKAEFRNIQAGFALSSPNLYQEGEEGDWEGQPIIWDGDFGWDEHAGLLRYWGHQYPSGEGDAVSRIVHAKDLITW